MRNIGVHCFLVMLLISSYTQAQNQKTYTINIDDSGKINSQLPDHLTSDDQLIFGIKSPKDKFDVYYKTYIDRITAAKKYINALEKNQRALTVLKKLYNIDVSDLNNVTDDIDEAIKRTGTPTKLPLLDDTYKKYYQLSLPGLKTPITKDLEPNSETGALTIELPDGHAQLDFTLTKTDPYRKLPTVWLENTKADYPKPVNFHTATIKKDSEVLYSLVQRIDDFLKQERTYAKQHKLDNGKPLDDGEKEQLLSFSKSAQKLIDEIAALNKQVNEDIVALGFKDDNYKKWMLEWMWYQNDKNEIPSINPFSFRRPDELPDEPDTSALEGLNIEIKTRQNIFSNTDWIKKTTELATVHQVIDETTQLKMRVAAIQKSAQKYSALLSGNDKAIKDFGQISYQLNKGILFEQPSGPEQHPEWLFNLFDPYGQQQPYIWMRNHDAASHNQLMEGYNNKSKDEYLETDRVVIIEHNLKSNEATNINFSLKDITADQDLLSSNIDPLLNQNSALQQFFGKAQINQTKSASAPNAETRAKALKAQRDASNALKELNELIDKLQKQLDEAKVSDLILNYLKAQSNPLLDVKTTTDVSKSYHSQVVNPPKKISGPKKAIYTLSVNTTPKSSGESDTATAKSSKAKSAAASSDDPDSFTFRINKLYRLFPMGGLNYAFTQFNDVSSDTVHKVSKSNIEQHIKFVVGLKIYLRKMDIRSPKFIIGKDNDGRCLFWSRTSIDLAFDASTPLNNLYTGVGFDLWPGVCLNVGSVFNRYTYTSYLSGQPFQSRVLYRPGIYAGFSTDLNLFADIAKLLNLSN